MMICEYDDKWPFADDLFWMILEMRSSVKVPKIMHNGILVLLKIFIMLISCTIENLPSFCSQKYVYAEGFSQTGYPYTL